MKPKKFDATSGDLLTPGNVKDILSLLNWTNGKSLGKTLDVGCNTTWMAQFVDDYYGVDVDANLVKSSKSYWQNQKRWNEDEANQRIHRISAEKPYSIPFPDNSFDTLILRDVIEHVDDCMSFFGEAARVLKADGVMYVSAPDNQPHVWNEPTHRRPFPLHALEYIGYIHNFSELYKGYEGMARGTQKLARLFGGRTPWVFRIFWYLPWWPRSSVIVLRKP